MNRKGFTLAEVLITLTIVGVIAALTIPNLIHQWHQKEFETRFNKSYSTISQALQQMKNEEGDHLLDTYVKHGYKDFATPFYKYFNKVQSYYKGYPTIKTYNNTNNAEYFGAMYQGTAYKINDFFEIAININWATLMIYIDTNTYKKAPNRLGYDIFLLKINENDQLVSQAYHPERKGESICSINDTTTKNGYNCTHYALLNKCPYDNTKTYWECLE